MKTVILRVEIPEEYKLEDLAWVSDNIAHLIKYAEVQELGPRLGYARFEAVRLEAPHYSYDTAENEICHAAHYSTGTVALEGEKNG